MNGGQDFSSIFSQEEKFFSRLSSRDVRYNSSKQGEASFRVLYYGVATGSVPFVWESQPGTPKHKFGGGSGSGGPLPPLTPPPQYMSSPLASPSLKKSRSKMFGSVFMRTPSKKCSAPASPSSSSSSYSSSYSLPSTPFHSDSKARLRSKIEFGDEYEEGRGSPTSTLCFRGGDGRRSKGYQFFYPMKKVVKSIAGGLRR